MIVVAGLASAQTNYAELNRLSKEWQAKAFAEKLSAEMIARQTGLPLKVKLTDGGEAELMRFENGQPRYYRTTNLTAAHTVNTSKLWPGGTTGHNLTGAGIKLGIWDGGAVRATHQEFGGRATVRDGAGISSHATHVGGTMIGAGVDGNARGGSFQATLDSWDWNSDTSEMAAQAAAGLTISNHSYGLITGWTSGNFGAGSGWYWFGNAAVSATEDVRFGLYDSEARAWDIICNNAQYYLPVKSAGNDRNEGPGTQPTGFYRGVTGAWVPNTVARDRDGAPSGYDCINGSGMSKNVLTIAAVNDVPGGWTSPASVTMSGFSSWGPTDDGRVKPDISANGVGLYSSYSTNDTSYASLNGTSMSSPNTSGSLGLLQQVWRQSNPNPMRSATLRGLVIHTANEAGPSNGPDYAFGHGLLNTAGASQVIKDTAIDGQSILESTLINNQPANFTYYSAGTGPVKVTICWNDPAGTVSTGVDVRTPKLVRDLDVRVTNSSGTHMPWTLNPDSPTSPAIQGDNIRDNVEVISILAPAAGNFNVVVTHKGTLSTPQPFSLIVTGWSNQPAGIDTVTLAPTSVKGGTSSVATVRLTSPAPFGGATIAMTSDNAAATVAPSVIIPFGQIQGAVTVNTTGVASTQVANIRGTYNSVVRSAPLQIQPPFVTNIVLNPTAVTGGSSSTATVSLDGPAPAGGMTISALSGNPAVATVPASVNVAGNATSTSFVVSTVSVASTQTALITASKDASSASATLTVNPAAAGFVPTSLAAIGVSTLGAIDTLWTSNNVRLLVEPISTQNKTMTLDFIGTGAANLTNLSLTFEGHAPSATMDVFAFNYQSNQWVLLGSITSATDVSQTWNLSPAASFVGPANAIKARMAPRITRGQSPLWQAFIDRVTWAGS